MSAFINCPSLSNHNVKIMPNFTTKFYSLVPALTIGHYLVPKHELEYKKGTVGCANFKKKYGEDIPIIMKSDPISRFYGYERGDIIKVTRKNGYVMFRIVK